LRHVSFNVAQGASLLVLGPSGCGKSTLSLCLNGAIPHFVEGQLEGRVRIGGRDTRAGSMADMAQRVGVVFQDPEAQFCMLTLEDEVAFGLENLAVPRAEMDTRIDEALAWVGLEDRRRDQIERLSGGQKQRLALGCVLAQRPDVLVFDEPTAQLDPVGAAEVVALLERLRAHGRHTLVIIEHRLDDLMPLVDEVLVLNQAGESIAQGPPRGIMSDWGEWLSSAGVWVPHVSELATSLADVGVRLSPFPLTVGEAVTALRPHTGRLAALPGRTLTDLPSPSMERQHFLQVNDLSFRYPSSERPVLSDIRLTLESSELTAVVGANGAGKTTLARHLVKILRPPSRCVRLLGVDLAELTAAQVARQVGYVFQYPEHQFVGRSVIDDVAFGLLRAGLPESQALYRAQAMLEEFGLADVALAHPFSISHGEQRRLSVAAMLALGQRGLFLDEPTFGQDRRNAHLLLGKLTALAGAGKAIIAITHDMRLVAEGADRAIAMSDGRIIFDGLPAKLFSDAAVLRQARLRPPPLTEVGQHLALTRPLLRISDVVDALRPVNTAAVTVAS
jgi:energy-coupling factor transporter ATP-binding protein EcfA2